MCNYKKKTKEIFQNIFWAKVFGAVILMVQKKKQRIDKLISIILRRNKQT